LSGHDARAVEKTKKAVKASSKSVAKKYIKSLKSIVTKKKETTTAKKPTPKAVAKIANTKRDRTGKFTSVKPSSNGVHKGSKHKLSLSSGSKGKVIRSVPAPHHN